MISAESNLRIIREKLGPPMGDIETASEHLEIEAQQTNHSRRRTNRGSRKMMEHNTILYISDRATSSNSVSAALRETGCQVVSTNSPTEGVALFYVLHSVAAVVLDNRAREQAGFDVAQSLGKIHPDVPVILLCGDQIDSSRSWTDRCVNTDKLAIALQHLRITEPVV